MKNAILILFIIASISAQCQTFTGSFKFIATQENQSETRRSDTISYYFSKDKTALIIKAEGSPQELRLVFHPTDSTITNLFEIKERKSGYILPMNKKYWPTIDYALQEYGTGPSTKLELSGEQKEINGILCTKIICKSELYDSVFWIAPEIELSFTQVMAYQTVGAGEDTEFIDSLAACGLQGFVMEAVIQDKKRNAVINVHIANLLEDLPATEVFSSEGHLLSDMRKNN